MPIRAKNVNIPKSAFIHPSAYIHCETFEVGEHSFIGKDVSIVCRSFKAGEYLYMTEGVEVGRGGCTNPESMVTIGDHVGIFEKTLINPNSPITIGDNVGIGCEVQIWTHGAWLDVLQGFPSSFGPVHIGDNVWLPARCIILPNVSIGKNSVIAINSVINKSLPSGCLAGGNPAKVIKPNVYPKTLTPQEKLSTLTNLIYEWSEFVAAKGHDSIEYLSVSEEQTDSLKVNIKLQDFNAEVVHFAVSPQTTITFKGSQFAEDVYSSDFLPFLDDLIDFLRRSGVKLFSHKRPFRSLPPKYMPMIES